MLEKVNGTTYFVTQPYRGTVAIIDGNTYNLIKTIEIEARPLGMAVDEKNYVYVASDRDGKITVINPKYEVEKKFDIPNNGNIEVDVINRRMYIGNTDEVLIYNIKTGEKIGSIQNFMAVNCLKLDVTNKKLFVLDTLKNELSVFSTTNLKLIKQYTNIGKRSSCICLGEERVYIVNKGGLAGNQPYKITIMNFESRNTSSITFSKGSVITELRNCKNCLYIVNNGLQGIEVLDLMKKVKTCLIKTTLPKILKICFSPDMKKLLATTRDDYGNGAIDIIDTATNIKVSTYHFQDCKSVPFDIVPVQARECGAELEELHLHDSLEDSAVDLTEIKELEKTEKSELEQEAKGIDNEINSLKETIKYKDYELVNLKKQLRTMEGNVKLYIEENKKIINKNRDLDRILLEKNKDRAHIQEKLAEIEKENEILKKHIQQYLNNSKEHNKNNAKNLIFKWFFGGE